MMKKTDLITVMLVTSLFLVACSEKEKLSETATEASAVQETKITSEQQAAIDSVDKPILDDKNKDVPAEVASAPIDTIMAPEENK